MAAYKISSDTLTAIADAVRAKTGKSETISGAELAAAIESIDVGEVVLESAGVAFSSEKVDPDVNYAIGYNWFAQIVAMLCAKNRVERTYTSNEILDGIEKLRTEVVAVAINEKTFCITAMETVHETVTAAFEGTA